MTKRGFGKQLTLAVMMMATLPIQAGQAQQDQPAAESTNKVGTLIKAGDILSGQLNALRAHGAKKGKRTAIYQLTSEPHRLPPPNGLCNLETGPETFQIVTSSDADAARLKAFVGKEISLKVDDVVCAQDAGQMSEAIVSKWSVVTKR
ncbi:hypothetical protein [Bradyrhizobium sp.]|uniref:hypothetical protein n=1 Tax=Bradyrhizobium sp. TaxID=376 RepID=UPI00261A3809|nr:hypothetical protein [Bradyrhizobium sp.]